MLVNLGSERSWGIYRTTVMELLTWLKVMGLLTC